MKSENERAKVLAARTVWRGTAVLTRYAREFEEEVAELTDAKPSTLHAR